MLSAAPFHYGSFAIGLFGLAGLLGAAAAQGGGRLHDRGHDLAGTIVAWLLVLVAFGFCALGGHSLVWLLLGTVMFDLAIQTQRILNQSQAFALAPNSRSRVNTAYIAGNFMGGACGSLLATALWAVGRWPAVTSTGACTAFVALAVCAMRARTRDDRLRALRGSASRDQTGELLVNPCAGAIRRGLRIALRAWRPGPR
jgi:predicted MFS family arabinose efflux permease